MVIHFHGTPITPKSKLQSLAGAHFCVSFSDPRDTEDCLRLGQSVLFDNGEFSRFTKGREADPLALHRWLGRYLAHPHRAVVLDRINGSVEEQRERIAQWPHPRDLSWPVWHLDKPYDFLLELADAWPGVCFGSAGEFWKIGSEAWLRRMDGAFDHLTKHRQTLPWTHGLRMLGRAGQQHPLSSADSTNIARNHAGNTTRSTPPKCPRLMMKRIDAVQCPTTWCIDTQEELFAA